jgi:hypothetical protein
MKVVSFGVLMGPEFRTDEALELGAGLVVLGASAEVVIRGAQEAGPCL